MRLLSSVCAVDESVHFYSYSVDEEVGYAEDLEFCHDLFGVSVWWEVL